MREIYRIGNESFKSFVREGERKKNTLKRDLNCILITLGVWVEEMRKPLCCELKRLEIWNSF